MEVWGCGRQPEQVEQVQIRRCSQDLLGKSTATSEGCPCNSEDAPSKLGSIAEVLPEGCKNGGL